MIKVDDLDRRCRWIDLYDLALNLVKCYSPNKSGAFFEAPQGSLEVS